MKNKFKLVMLISSGVFQAGELSRSDRETLSICYGEDKVQEVGTRQQMLLFLAQQAIEHRKSVGKLIHQTLGSHEGDELKREYRLKHGQIGIEEWERKIKPAYDRLDEILLSKASTDALPSSLQELLFFAQEAIDHRKTVKKFQQALEKDEMDEMLPREMLATPKVSCAVQTDGQELEVLARLKCELGLAQTRQIHTEKAIRDAHESLAKSESSARSTIADLEGKLGLAQTRQVHTEKAMRDAHESLAKSESSARSTIARLEEELKVATDYIVRVKAPSHKFTSASSWAASNAQEQSLIGLMRENQQLRSSTNFKLLSKKLKEFTACHVEVTERVINNNNEYCNRVATYLTVIIPKLLKVMKGMDIDITNQAFLSWVHQGLMNITYSVFAKDGSVLPLFEDKRLQYGMVTKNWFANANFPGMDSESKRLDNAIKLIQNTYKIKERSPKLFAFERLSQDEDKFYNSVQRQSILLRKSTAQLCSVILKDLITLQKLTRLTIDSIITHNKAILPYALAVPESVLFYRYGESSQKPTLHFEQHTATGVMQHCEDLAKKEYLLLPEEDVALQLYKQLKA